MIFELGFVMCPEEVVQDVQLGQHMPLITTVLCLLDVIDNHIPHSLSSARLAQLTARAMNTIGPGGMWDEEGLENENASTASRVNVFGCRPMPNL